MNIHYESPLPIISSPYHAVRRHQSHPENIWPDRTHETLNENQITCRYTPYHTVVRSSALATPSAIQLAQRSEWVGSMDRKPYPHATYRGPIVAPVLSVAASDPESYKRYHPALVPNTYQISQFTVFTSPTATFTWPRLLPASQMGRGLYITIQCTSTPVYPGPLGRDTVDRSQHGTSVLKKHRSEEPNHCPDRIAVSKIPRSLTSDRYGAWPRSVRQHLILDKHQSPAVEHDLHHTHIHSPPTDYSEEYSLNVLDSTGHLGPQNRKLSTPISRSRESNISESSIPPRRPQTTSPLILRSKQWEKHAEALRRQNGHEIYRCRWRFGQGENEMVCTYSAKKQLVKRHVQTTHLKLKPYICEKCRKGFPQKTYLNIHVSGHTGQTPHKCKYNNCGKAFKDPARRHRHYVKNHGYVPKKYKKKYMASVYQLEK